MQIVQSPLANVPLSASRALLCAVSQREDRKCERRLRSRCRCFFYPPCCSLSYMMKASKMDKVSVFLLVTLFHHLAFQAVAGQNCCPENGGSEVELVNGCVSCNSECNCSIENCSSCQGDEKCCYTCCEKRCDCNAQGCTTSCSGQMNQCCVRNGKCRNSECSMTKQCSQCNCEICEKRQTMQHLQTSCCSSCCSKSIEKKKEDKLPKISQFTTLPNITVIINQAPIYVNNSPIVNTQHRCGNASLVNNGTHIIYVYPQNSTCPNRTCCMREIRQACRPMPHPLPPVCPPPLYVRDCSPRCQLRQQFSQSQSFASCQYFQSWPFVHCPMTGCYGFSCAPPLMAPPLPPMAMQGCMPVSRWPFMRCVVGAQGESMISYGAPSYQVMMPSGVGALQPINGDNSGAHSTGVTGSSFSSSGSEYAGMTDM